MIDLIFNQANEVIIVKVNGKAVTFGSTTYGAMMGNIDGLRLDYFGTIREFPDLKDDIDWKAKAVKRFKEHIQKLNSEGKTADYLIYELRNKGFTPKLKQVAGFRPVRIQ